MSLKKLVTIIAATVILVVSALRWTTDLLPAGSAFFILAMSLGLLAWHIGDTLRENKRRADAADAQVRDLIARAQVRK